MSDIAVEIDRVSQALRRPTLRLLHHRRASFILAVFRVAFHRQKLVPVDLLHTIVDTWREDLQQAAAEAAAVTEGKSVCMSWVKEQWLRRVVIEGGTDEGYELTSNALEALRLVDALAEDRALVSESRLSTIVQAVRRWAVASTGDRDFRVADLDDQIAALQAERARLTAQDEAVDTASVEDMAEGFEDLMDMMSQLPGDFRRVEESLRHIRQRMMADFMADQRPKGEVLHDYLARVEHLMDSTVEGRAFSGALRVLSDDRQMARLRRDLRTIMEHEFADALPATSRSTFLSAENVLREGLQDVLSEQRRATASLKQHIRSYDSVQEQELRSVLRDVSAELAAWMQTAGPRATVPVDDFPAKISWDHLEASLYEPPMAGLADPLVDVSTQAPDPLSLQDLRISGGPQLKQVQQAVAAAIDATAGDDGYADVAEAFNDLPASLRRPVEVFGLLHVAAQLDGAPAVDAVQVTTQRPDGTELVVQVPSKKATADQVIAVSGGSDD